MVSICSYLCPTVSMVQGRHQGGRGPEGANGYGPLCRYEVQFFTSVPDVSSVSHALFTDLVRGVHITRCRAGNKLTALRHSVQETFRNYCLLICCKIMTHKTGFYEGQGGGCMRGPLLPSVPSPLLCISFPSPPFLPLCCH